MLPIINVSAKDFVLLVKFVVELLIAYTSSVKKRKLVLL